MLSSSQCKFITNILIVAFILRLTSAQYSQEQCLQNCISPNSKHSFTRTSMPQVVLQNVFNGENCQIYEEGVIKNCQLLAKDVVKIENFSYFLVPYEMSWFAAQRFCHVGGWMLGAVTGAAMEKEMMRHWQAKLGSSSLWSGVNSYASNGATFANAESGLVFTDPDLPKESTDSKCLIYSSFDTGIIKKRGESCTKKARFFCQLHPLCPMSIDSCDNSACKITIPKTKLIPQDTTTPCAVPICLVSQWCEDRVQPTGSFVKPKVPVPSGLLRSVCGRNFYFARDFYPLSSAVDFCCSIGMKMVSVENAAKLSCLTDAISQLDSKEMGSRWWTSATDAGCQGKLAWCGSGQMYSEAAVGTPEGWKERRGKSSCIVLKSGKISAFLSVANCEEFNRPLCEGHFVPRRVYDSKMCPRVRCRMNETWTDALAVCCSMGLRLMQVAEPEVLGIMQKIMIEKVKEDNLYNNKRDKVETLSFWTAGYEWSSGNFVWCPTGENLPNFNSWTGVKVENPSNGRGGNCLVAVLGDTRKLILDSCTTKQNFICETYEAEVSKGCEIGTCHYNGSPEEVQLIESYLREVNENLKFPLANWNEIKSYEKKGKVLMDTCNRHIFLSRDLFYFHQQSRYCHSLGMTPLYIETTEDWKCILGAMGDLDFGKGNYASAHFPLADTFCPGKFVWCGTGKPLKKELVTAWSENHFDDYHDKYKTCTNIYMEKTYGSGKARTYRESCEKFEGKRKIVCQVPAN